ncbi:MAG: tail fiber domain-containing protein, partial [Aeromonas veronii]
QAAGSATSADAAYKKAVTSESNAKVSETNAANSASASLASKNAAKVSETNAASSAVLAKASEDDVAANAGIATDKALEAKGYADSASASKVASAASQVAAKSSEDKAKASETASASSAAKALVSEGNAKKSEDAAKASEGVVAANVVAAKASEDNAKLYEADARASMMAAAGSATTAGTNANLATSEANKAKGYAAEALTSKNVAVSASANVDAGALTATTKAAEASSSASAAKVSQDAAKVSETNAAASAAAVASAVVTHEGKAGAHPISGVTGLQAALDGKYSPTNKPTSADVGAIPVSKLVPDGGVIPWADLVNKIPVVSSAGLTELGRYIDLRKSGSDTDYSWRIDAGDSNTPNLRLFNTTGVAAEFGDNMNLTVPYGDIYVGKSVTSKGSVIKIQSDHPNQHFWFKDSNDVERALIFHQKSDNRLYFRVSGGHAASLGSNGDFLTQTINGITNGGRSVTFQMIGQNVPAIAINSQYSAFQFLERNGGSGLSVMENITNGITRTCSPGASNWNEFHNVGQVAFTYGINAGTNDFTINYSGGNFIWSDTLFTLNGSSLTIKGTGYAPGGWHVGSDVNFKTNIKPLSIKKERWLDKVCSLNAKSFTYKSDERNAIGFIAQDVQAIIPEAVNVKAVVREEATKPSDKVDRLFIDPMALIAAQNEAIKELRSEINKLKEIINELVLK